MAKKSFGKFIAFTTAVTAIGGVCYIYRDKIKESSIYQSITGKIADWMDKDIEPDDFNFDDDDFDDAAVFDDDARNNREYTSITITSANTEESISDTASESTGEEPAVDEPASDDATSDDATSDDTTTGKPTSDDATTDDVTNNVNDDTVSDITDDIEEMMNPTEEIIHDEDISSFDDIVVNPSISSASMDSTTEETTVDAYENEGLSDVSEDPDVLEDQDKLDF